MEEAIYKKSLYNKERGIANINKTKTHDKNKYSDSIQKGMVTSNLLIYNIL
jgi:hypothetical protein